MNPEHSENHPGSQGAAESDGRKLSAGYTHPRFPRIVAHRGASGYAPENTAAAFLLALQMKADFIELDVQMSRDGVLVAFHDSRVDRTTNRKGRLSEFAAAELAEMDAGSWFNSAFPFRARPEHVGLKIPTLQQTFDLIANSDVGLYIELKSPELQPPHFESEILHQIRQNRFEKRVIILSFSRDSLQKIRHLNATIETSLLVSDRRERPIPTAHAISSGMLGMRYGLITRPLVNRIRQEQLAIAVWTVDAEIEMQRMIEFGVDSITTNYPDRLSRLLETIR